MGKKKLDELFKEKFTDFEQVPDEKVWHALEASLDKKERRMIPLWWKLGGVAAVLVIGLLAINPFAGSTDGKPAITDTDIQQNTVDSTAQQKNKETKILDTTDAHKTQLTEVNSQDTKEDASNNNEVNSPKNETSGSKKDLKLSPSNKSKQDSQLTSAKEEEKRDKAKSNKIDPQPNILITDNKAKKDNDPKENFEQLKRNLDEGIAERDTVKKAIPKESVAETIAQQDGKSTSIKEEKDIIKEKVVQTGIAQNDTEQKNDKVADETIEEDKKKSIFDEIEQEEEVVAENEPRKRWSAGPSVAPVYFDAFGQGSPVHSILVPNAKSGETNLSYGLSVAYEINDRLSVRSGVHKVDYGYDTGDIEFTSSLDGAVTDQMENINYAATARNLVVRSKVGATAVAVGNSSTEQAFDATNTNNSIARNGTMSQQLGYLEVPVELNYALVDRKIGLNLIGGFSSLFLVNNSVSLTAGDETTQMGEANNVNNVNFSTNIGLGIDYDFTPKIKLNIEPLFKYQLNTFSQVDGNFNPFSIGIYSGLTFKF